MNVYIAVLSTLCFFTLIGETNRNNNIGKGLSVRQKNSAFFMLLILALVAGLRYYVGTDYSQYILNYESYKTGELSIVEEPGIRILARITSFVSDNGYTMIFFAAVITVALIGVTLVRNSSVYWLSILLYVLTGTWHGCFNGVRQYLAMAILFAGHRFLYEKKFWKWCIVVCIASLFHVSAIFALLFYFFAQMKISKKQGFICLIIIVVGWSIYDQLYKVMGFLRNTTIDQSLDYMNSAINPFRILVSWVPILICLIFQKYYDRNNRQYRFYFNMSLLNAVLMTIAMNSTYMGRIAIYTSGYPLIFWPIILKKFEIRSRKIMIVLLLFFYLIYWYREASGPYLNTFRWVFEML